MRTRTSAPGRARIAAIALGLGPHPGSGVNYSRNMGGNRVTNTAEARRLLESWAQALRRQSWCGACRFELAERPGPAQQQVARRGVPSVDRSVLRPR